MSPRAVFQALNLLTPYDIDIPKIRVGGPHDGGYILANLLRSSQPVLSYGIGPDAQFDAELAARGHTIHMFDHTIEAPSAQHPNFRFYKQGVASTESEGFGSIPQHLATLCADNREVILKLDIEGAEWDVLASLEAETLSAFQQILIEVHNLHLLGDPDFNAKACRVFEGLNRQFTLFHVHGNNCEPLRIVDGMMVVSVLELSYVRTELVRRQRSATLYPSALDRPNHHLMHDHLLWFFPFLPSAIDEDRFTAASIHNEMQFRLGHTGMHPVVV